MDPIEIVIDNVSLTGDGIARTSEGKVVFVPRALSGERVIVQPTKDKKKFMNADLVEVLDPAPDRTPPDCRHFDDCGGCAFWHTKEDGSIKFDAVRQTLKRIGGWEGPIDSVAAPIDRRWRIRGTVHVRGGKLGFFRRSSQDLFALEECLMFDPRISSVLSDLDLSKRKDGSIFCEISGDQTVHLTLSGDIEAGGPFPSHPQISGQTVGRRRRDEESIQIEVLGKTVKIPSGLFRQSNPSLNQRLVEFVRLHVPAESDVVEYFCGYGNFTFEIATKASHVFAYEADQVAITTGDRIATTLKVGDVTFETCDLFINVPLPESASCVVMDPPRAGANAVCQKVVATPSVERVIYISCDPATFARDLATLREGGFDVLKCEVLDMFPKTAHVEIAAVFERKN